MKLSVIVPVYNVETYLEQCVNSITGQSYTDLEIILVNDGSTDNSGKICDHLAEIDSRVTVIHQQNAGVSVARNRGMEASTGGYLTFVDSDDWLHIDMYQTMLAVIVKDEVDVIMCDTLNVSNENLEKITCSLAKGYYNKPQIIKEIYPTLLVKENFDRIPIVSACCCLFKTSLLRKYNIEFDAKLKFSEDYLFMAKMMLHAQSFFYVKGFFGYHYRQYNLSRSKLYQDAWWENLVYLNNQLKEAVGSCRDFDFSRQLKLQLLHSLQFTASAVRENKNISLSRKIRELRRLFRDVNVRNAFVDFPFKKRSFSQKVVLYLIKYKMAAGYAFYLKLVNMVRE